MDGKKISGRSKRDLRDIGWQSHHEGRIGTAEKKKKRLKFGKKVDMIRKLFEN
jgi:hypothetical protein